MAEQEVIKHTEKVISIVKDPSHSIWHKIKEFITEILIIVFAISLSIWFHNWSEHRNEQAQVKTFLLGLKNDISSDIHDLSCRKKAGESAFMRAQVDIISNFRK